MVRLAIVIVSWNTRELLARCIESLGKALDDAPFSTQIVVVDNASHDGTPALLRDRFPDVELIETGANLGFAGGNNVALRQLLAMPNPPEYVFLLNPDTEVVGDAIQRMIAYLEAHPDVAVVGPRLRYPDGSIQPSRRRFPTPGVFFWESTPLEQWWRANPWAQRYRMANAPDDAEQDVDWLVGAALLVRRSAIERAGVLDEGFLMYSEELEWQQRIQRASNGSAHRVVYLPDALILHHEGQSSAQAPAQRYINFQRSRIRHARMCYGAGFAMLLRAWLRLAYGLEYATEAAKWVVGHKRSLRAERMRVYRQVITQI